jgi:hypothetical protein
MKPHSKAPIELANKQFPGPGDSGGLCALFEGLVHVDK